jgi:hypothetical protein
VTTAVTALGNDVHNAGAGEVNNMTAVIAHQHFEHIWH